MAARESPVTGAAHITDGTFLARLVARIGALPADGNLMIKMGAEAELIELAFDGSSGVRTVQIYAGRFKTPTTGFNAGSARGDAERKLYEDLAALLSPAPGKIIPKVKGLELTFDGFSVTFDGSESYDHAPDTLSGSVDVFLVKPTGGAGQRIEISSGQLPPAPKAFSVGKTRLSLVTYETKKGDRLFPHDFQITP